MNFTKTQNFKFMHIIIGVLTAVAGLFWAITALQNSGAIESLNPFLWYRRAQWRKKLEKKPMYSLTEPIDVAGLLIVGIAKLEGEFSKELKQEILNIFEKDFHMSSSDAQSLFKSSSFLMKEDAITNKDIENIFERSRLKFSQDQVASMLSIMKNISSFDNEISTEQKKIIETTDEYFLRLHSKNKKW